MVPSAIWDSQDVWGYGWSDRMGHHKNGDYAPVREFYGPTGKWHGNNGTGHTHISLIIHKIQKRYTISYRA